MSFTVLVAAKAPEPGRVKTRLGSTIGMTPAAEVAAAALLDTVVAATDAVGTTRCHLSLDGDLDRAVRSDELRTALTGWTLHPQVGADLGARLADAHRRVPGPVVQVGMDTPQLTPALLHGAAAGLAEHDAVLGPAADGGWWVLALRDPAAASALVGLEMSTSTTYADTWRALGRTGLRVGATTTLTDVDTPADADLVAAHGSGPHFTHAWAAVAR